HARAKRPFVCPLEHRHGRRGDLRLGRKVHLSQLAARDRDSQWRYRWQSRNRAGPGMEFVYREVAHRADAAAEVALAVKLVLGAARLALVVDPRARLRQAAAGADVALALGAVAAHALGGRGGVVGARAQAR